MKPRKLATDNLWQEVRGGPTETVVTETPPPPPPESKADKFVRLAQRRVSQAVSRISQLIPLANRNNYGYTMDHAEKIKSALLDAVGNVVVAFAQTSKQVSTFEF
jgi:hypothetical protein